MTATVKRYAEGALSTTSNALHTVGKVSWDAAVKLKNISLLALSKIGEYLSFMGSEFVKISKVVIHYGGITAKFSVEKAVQGGKFAANRVYNAAVLTKSLVLTHPQLFCGVGIGLGIGALAVCSTYYLVK